ncbi:alpha-2-macroglobulin [Luteolibacter sp. LG18]|uniref:alpha-2-macroglobulin n=1 Tax=Luteolibacter sp. LG18 TaxID=2819286 RepID=UPI002B2DF52F|nr:UPF0192 protein [Luteolibacter sp. LG18]
MAAHPRGWGITLAALAGIAGGIWGGMRWWEAHRPRVVVYQEEQKVQVSWTAPPSAGLGVPEKNLSPSPVTIRFSLPVAPLERVGKEPGPGVKLEPARHGIWKWQDNRTLVFTPEDLYWPAAAKYSVTLAPEGIAPLMKLDRTTLEFSTEPSVAMLRDFNFYTSPADPTVHQVVGELWLRYPATQEDVTRQARLEVMGHTAVFAPAPDGTPDLMITQGQDARQWFLRSRNLIIPGKEDFAKLSILAGLVPASGGEALKDTAEVKTRIPDKFTGFTISGAQTRIIRTDEGEPQQFLFISTSVALESSEIASHLQAWWRSEEVDGWDTGDKARLEQQVAAAKKIQLMPVESEAPLSNQHAFRFIEPRPGFVLVRVSPGVKAPGGFELGAPYQDITGVPEFPKEVQILGKGNILTLGGARRMVVESRGIDHLRFTVGRVPISQVQHLVTQNDYGDFSDLRMNSTFPETSLVQRWRKLVKVPHENEWQAVKTELDLHEAPAMSAPDRLEGGFGIFVVEAEAVKKLTPVAPDTSVFGRIETPDDDDAPSKPYLYEEGEDARHAVDGWVEDDAVRSQREDDGREPGRRFVMITDLGLVAKTGPDGKRDVFVMSLGAGQPVAGVTLKALARNGTVLVETVTGADGKASLPSLEGFVQERQPVAVLAVKGNDVTFLPLRRSQLQSMDFSRFDTEGVLASRQKAVEGFVFTERGIYRPGDMVNGGVLVRRRDWSPVLEGLPVRITLTDSQGRTAGEQKIRLPYDGFFEVKLPLTEGAVLGQYHLAAAVLDSEDRELFRLGRASLKVEEFQPDRMKVATVIDPAPGGGWMSPADAKAKVSVNSLFGEPAAERRVTMRLEYSTAEFSFEGWEGFTFHDPTAQKSKSQAGRTVDLGEVKTGEDGVAEFNLPLASVPDVSFRMAVLTEAFEREGGRSVRHALTQLVSPLEQVIGWKPDGDLDYLGKDAVRTVKFIALDRAAKPVAMAGLHKRLIEIRRVSVLTKQDNGNYAYVSTEREKTLGEEDLAWQPEGIDVTVQTGQSGSFRLEVLDAAKRLIAAVPYRVAGKGDRNRSVDSEAELELVLSKGEAQPGEEIEIHLTAPYAGAGLVTFERDRVLAHQWFHTDTTETTVKMKVPEDMGGTLYVNAAFVRSPSSPEVFRSPLSYAAAPLRVAPLRHQLGLKLEAPKVARPGTEVKFSLSSDKPARVLVYAVDEGIHQITNYKLPRPLDYFSRKQALEVETLQWLDLLLPEYQFLKSAPAFGGDADSALAMHVNPFKRRQEAPVVYWSGMVESGPQAKELKWLVPDYFNGNLRVMAVAARADGIGVAETSTLARSPIILLPNAPLFASPGDEFEASLAVTCNLNAPTATDIKVTVKPGAELETVGAAEAVVNLAQGKEGMVRFRFRAKDALGGTELKFTATAGGETVNRAITLSVRPASHHLTKVTSGWFRTGNYEVKTTRQLYPELRRADAMGSVLPIGLARGLEAYVSGYPHGCSEQITSRAMVKLLASTEVDFGLKPEVAAEHIRGAIAQLANRQQSDGGFGYWYSGAPRAFEFHSLYVLHFLTEAKLLGHPVPEDMMKGAVRYVSATARAPIGNLREAELQAYAIYLMARNGENPAPQLLNLRDTLTKAYAGKWEGSSTAAWMAGTYRLLKQDKEGAKLMAACMDARAKNPPQPEPVFWYDRTPDAEALKIFYVRCRHFPEDAKDFGYDDLAPVMEPLKKENFTTLTASFMTLALKAYGDAAAKTGLELTLVAKPPSGAETVLAGPAKGIVRSPFPVGSASVGIRRKQNGSGDIGAFFQVTEQGYDRGKPPGPETSGLGVFREIKPVDTSHPVRPGDSIAVTLRVRNLSTRSLTNVAVVDLLPAGFEVVAGDLKSGAGTVAGTTFAELREDRSLFYLDLGGNGEWSVSYRMKAVSPGSFVVPPAMAEDMYDRGRHGLSEPTRIEVKPAL